MAAHCEEDIKALAKHDSIEMIGFCSFKEL